MIVFWWSLPFLNRFDVNLDVLLELTIDGMQYDVLLGSDLCKLGEEEEIFIWETLVIKPIICGLDKTVGIDIWTIELVCWVEGSALVVYGKKAVLNRNL